MISLITICYNEKKRIEKTCRSIADQDNKDYEWIVIDGGSTDGTLNILEQYREFATYIISEPDKGIYNAMNKGIKLATGEYLLFLNGGDYLSGAHVIGKLNALGLQKDIIIGDILYETTDDRLYPACHFDRYKRNIKRTLDYGYTLFHQSTLIKRELILDLGSYDESYRIAGDYDLFLKALVKSGCSYEYFPLFISVFFLEGIGRDEKHQKIWQDEVNLAINRNYSLLYKFSRRFHFRKGKNLRKLNRFHTRIMKLINSVNRPIAFLYNKECLESLDISSLKDAFSRYKLRFIEIEHNETNTVEIEEDTIAVPMYHSTWLNNPNVIKNLGRSYLFLLRGGKLDTDRMKRAFSVIKSCPEYRVVIDENEERSEISHACLDLDFELVYSPRKYSFEMKTRVVKG